MGKKKLVDLNKGDCPAYIDVFKKLCNLVDKGQKIDRNIYYNICNDSQVDTNCFIMDCSNYMDKKLATFNYKNKGLVFEYESDDNGLNLDNLKVRKLTKNDWSYRDLYLNFDFNDIQDTAERIGEITDWEDYPFSIDGEKPKLEEYMEPIEKVFREGFNIFGATDFGWFCYKESTDLYGI